MKEELVKQEEAPVQEVMPLVDILEEANEVTMWFEIPGANSGTVSIEVKERILTMRAESSLRKGGRKIVFLREFQLSDLIDVSKIEAKTENGVLTLTLPKSEQAKVHKIKVC